MSTNIKNTLKESVQTFSKKNSEPQRPIPKPKDNFNSHAEFSKYKAQLKQKSDTINDGDCLFDACLQGMHLNEDARRFTSYRELRKSSSRWAIQHPEHLIGKDLTLIQYLGNHLNHLSREINLTDYKDWWKKMETSKSYAESPVLAVLSAYLDYNICVWRRITNTSENLNFACFFAAKTKTRQIHLLLDGEADSVCALDGHF